MSKSAFTALFEGHTSCAQGFLRALCSYMGTSEIASGLAESEASALSAVLLLQLSSHYLQKPLRALAGNFGDLTITKFRPLLSLLRWLKSLQQFKLPSRVCGFAWGSHLAVVLSIPEHGVPEPPPEGAVGDPRQELQAPGLKARSPLKALWAPMLLCSLPAAAVVFLSMFGGHTLQC